MPALRVKTGKAGEAEGLGALDLAVPVGALDEAHHDAAPVSPGQRAEPVDDVDGPLAVGLHHHPEPVPAAERGVAQHRVDDIEREVEALRLLRIHVEPDAGRVRAQGERAQAGRELGRHAVPLPELVTRMQGRELDGDARPVADAGTPADACERADRLRIGAVVAARIRLGAGRLAQHVVGIAVALRLHRGRTRDGLVHVAAEHEVVPELAHRLGDRGADDRLAHALDGAHQHPGQAGLRVAQHLAGQQQRPGGGIDQRRARLPEMRRPVRGADLVLDQRVDGLAVGHAQQRLGEAHERHALAGREPVLGEEALHDRGAGAGPDGADQIDRARADGLPVGPREPRDPDHAAQRARFLFEDRGAHGRPNPVECACPVCRPAHRRLPEATIPMAARMTSPVVRSR